MEICSLTALHKLLPQCSTFLFPHKYITVKWTYVIFFFFFKFYFDHRNGIFYYMPLPGALQVQGGQ